MKTNWQKYRWGDKFKDEWRKFGISGIMCCRIINNVSQPKLNSTNCNNKDIVFCGAESLVVTVRCTVVNIDCFVCFVGLDICWQIQHTHNSKDKLCYVPERWWWWAHHKQLHTIQKNMVLLEIKLLDLLFI